MAGEWSWARLAEWMGPKLQFWLLSGAIMVGIYLLAKSQAGASAPSRATARGKYRSSSGGGLRKVIAVEEDKETVSRVFARAAYFKVVENDRVIDVVKNPYVEVVPAGPPVAELVARYNPSVVVTGSIGGIARRALEEKGIRIQIS